MNIRDYQNWTQTTSLDTEVDCSNEDVADFLDITIALGQYAGKLKKFYRDSKELDFTSWEVVQEWAQTSNTENYKNLDPKWLYMFLGAFDELVEFFNACLEFCNGENTDHVNLTKEYGDLNYYISQLGLKAGIDQEQALVLNQNKLESRKRRGVLRGDGDNR